MWIIDIILNLIVIGSRKGSRTPLLAVIGLGVIILMGTIIAVVSQGSVG